MRNRYRTLGATATTLATTVALAAALPASAARPSAAPAALYAPSALVLTLSHGQNTEPQASVSRAVTLSCTPTPTGTHPAPEQACAQLENTGGSFTALQGEGAICYHLADPVTVTAEGVWQGKRISYRETFANPCYLHSARGPVFDF
ncbi:subtilase-type protease inhibitor [Kitasatospora sp. NPDC085895]|uniref:subtilase-type protease inhibitor n=1 Tax=Kitasatospora sp. NPDC085895 TaxID=3155057 RepID=UPI00344EF222